MAGQDSFGIPAFGGAPKSRVCSRGWPGLPIRPASLSQTACPPRHRQSLFDKPAPPAPRKYTDLVRPSTLRLSTPISASFSHLLDGAQVFGIHNISAVFVFHNGHRFAGAVGLFNQKHFIGGRVAHLAVDAFKCGIGFFLGRELKSKPCSNFGVAHFIGGRIVRFVIPAAGIGAGALVGSRWLK